MKKVLVFIVLLALSGCNKEVTTDTTVLARDIEVNVVIVVDKETALKAGIPLP
jgi:hypothetical protein